MVLRFVLGRTDNALVQAERFKLLAGGAQLVAIGILAAAIVAPTFNPSVGLSAVSKLAGGGMAALIELLALRLMGYAVVVDASNGADDRG